MTEHLPDVDQLPAKDLLQIAETIERRPVLGHWPHMRAASDAEAVRRAAGEVARLRLREQQLTEALVRRRERIGHLQREIDTCGLQCSATMKSLVAENERLRTALTGVSSTCEACRGAALRALGDDATKISAAVWQPIDTIPKGEWVLIDCGNAGIIEGIHTTHESGLLGYWDSYGSAIHGPLHWITLDALPDTPTQPPGDVHGS